MRSLGAFVHFTAGGAVGLATIASRYYDAFSLSNIGLENKANLEHLGAGFAASAICTSALASRLCDNEGKIKAASSASWIGAGMYLGSHLLHELNDSMRRGYMQWDQIAADFVGFSIPFVYLAATSKKLKKPSLYLLRKDKKNESEESSK